MKERVSSRTIATWPFQKIDPPGAVKDLGQVRDRLAHSFLLHVAVARARDAASCEGDLHEPGTVKPEAGLAAPEIWRTDEALGDHNEIHFICGDRRKMPCQDVTS